MNLRRRSGRTEKQVAGQRRLRPGTFGSHLGSHGSQAGDIWGHLGSFEVMTRIAVANQLGSNALYTQRSNMLLNKEIQMQRPNKLHNKTQQPVEEKIQLHKDPTHCIIRSNQLLTLLTTPTSRRRFGRDPYKK